MTNPARTNSLGNQPNQKKVTMPTYIHIGNDTQTTFKCPSNSVLKHPYINGKPVHFITADQQTVTLETAPTSGEVLEIYVDPPDDANGNAPKVGGAIETMPRPMLPTVRFLSPEKLQQISRDCGGTVSAVAVGQFLADSRYDLNAVAAILSTTPTHLLHALARDENSSNFSKKPVTR